MSSRLKRMSSVLNLKLFTFTIFFRKIKNKNRLMSTPSEKLKLNFFINFWFSSEFISSSKGITAIPSFYSASIVSEDTPATTPVSFPAWFLSNELKKELTLKDADAIIFLLSPNTWFTEDKMLFWKNTKPTLKIPTTKAISIILLKKTRMDSCACNGLVTCSLFPSWEG